MTRALRVDEKDPAEVVPLSWDFTEDLASLATIPPAITGVPLITVAVDSSLFRGKDPNVGSMLVGSPQVAGNVVIQMVGGGVDRVDYKVTCQATIDSTPNAVLFKTSVLPVRGQ